MIRPKVSIIATSAQNSEKPLYTYLVDPNPDKQEVFDAEDRFLYVNLEAYKKSRSVIIEDESGIDFASSQSKQKPISFITTTKENGEDYVTTNYINVDGTESTVEGFGITSINIDQAADFVPKVNIKFFDVRGSTLKSFELDNGSKNSTNPLSTFFTYPYPLFKLTIKGYYGNPVSYCLHLIKTDYTFNADDGGYVIDAEFVGYTYGFLSDIPVKYLYSLPNTLIGRKKLEDKGAKSLSEVINDYAKLTRFVAEFKQNNSKYETIRKINTIINDVEQLRRILRPLISNENQELFSSNILTENINSSNTVFIRNVGIFYTSTRAAYNIFYNDVKVKIDNIKSTLAANNFSFSDISIESISTPRIDSNLSSAISEVKSLINENEPDYDLSSLDEEKIRQRNESFTDQGRYYYIDFYNIRSWIKRVLEFLNKQKSQLSSNVTDDLNEIIKTTFNPTIEEFFKHFTANIEVFNEIIYDFAIQASADSIQQKRREIIGTGSDIKENDEIYPFPDVIINQKKSWLGQLDNIDEVNFPEIKLINIFVNSLYDLNTIQKSIAYNQQLIQGIENENLNWVPINAIDIFDSPYNDLNFATTIEEFFRVLVKRFFTLNNYSNYIENESFIKTWAKLESKYAYEVIKNNQYKNLFTSSNIDTDVLFNQLLNENFIFEINNEYGVLEPEVSGISLNNDNILIIKTLSPDFFNQLNSKTNNYNNDLENFISTNEVFIKLTQTNEYKISSEDIQFKDLSLKYLNEVTSGQLQNIEQLKSLQVIDGYLNIENPLAADQTNPYTETTNNVIGRDKYEGNYSIFDIKDYSDFSDDLKRFLILDSLGLKEDLLKILDDLSFKSAIYILPKPVLLYFGAILNLQKKYYNNEISDINNFISDNLLFKDYFNFYSNENYNRLVFDKLIEYANIWPYKELEGYLINYTNAFKNNITVSDNQINYDLYLDAYNGILNFYTRSEVIAVSDPYGIKGMSKLANKENFSLFYEEFKKEFLKKNIETQGQREREQQRNRRVLNDNDILLEIYTDLKAYYDKWISYGEKGGKVFNTCFDNKDKGLFEHFYFIDRAWNDIGSKVVLNPRSLLKLFKNDRINCYEFIGSLLNDNNFSVHFAPSHVSFRKPDDLVDMFTPQTSLKKAVSNPAVIAFYVGELSKYLKSDQNYKEDGFNLESDNIPDDFSSRTLAQRHINDTAPYQISSFLVNHGDTNQSHFKDINISTTEYQNTAEYLKTQSDLLDKGGAINRFYKGLDIYDLYKFRSYSATVNAMGNMMIQPFQYFQMNIPLFRGAYIITNTTHNLTAHNHETTFKGYKISRYVMPLVEEVTSYIDLSFDQSYAPAQLSLNNNAVVTEDSVGFDTVDDILQTTDLSENEVLRAVNEDGGIIRYVLVNNLNISTFNENLNRVFLNNESQMNSYGISSGYCMKWVKSALYDIGIVSIPFGGVDAWDLFAGISSVKIKYFDRGFSSEGLSRAYDYASQINNRLSLVFGYFPTSRHLETSINAIKNIRAFEKIEALSSLNRTNFEFNPITHIGIYYDGRFYDLVNGVRINPVSSFVPIAHVDLYNDVEFLLINQV